MKLVSRTDQTLVIGAKLHKLMKDTNITVPDFINTAASITTSLILHALIGERGGYSSKTMEDVKASVYGFYLIDYKADEGYDHSFVIFINGETSSIIQSYTGKYFLRQDNFQTEKLIELLQDIPTNYNTLFFVDKPYHAEVKGIDIIQLHLNGVIRENLEEIPSSKLYLRFINEALQPYGYAIVSDSLVLLE